MSKVIITVATTGESVGKQNNPAVPITPKEIAQAVYEAWQAGASIAHVHVRDDKGLPTMALEKFKETVALIKEKCDIVLNLTTSGDIRAGDDARIQHLLTLQPEMATFDCGTMNWMYEDVFENHPRFLEKLGRVMLEQQIKPEVEIFDTGMISNARHYIEIGLLKEPVHFQFVMGAAGGIPATIDSLLFLLQMLPKNATWSAFGIGRYHLPIMTASLLLGGHVRVGFEDNIYYSRGVLAKSNAELVMRASRLATELGRPIATSQDVRAIFGLKELIN